MNAGAEPRRPPLNARNAEALATAVRVLRDEIEYLEGTNCTGEAGRRIAAKLEDCRRAADFLERLVATKDLAS